ncbi:MAG: hypothetical protein LUE86_14065 [Clostridiales bacterium]|nr:hypothetical protein [Clostridiales bacterium]
MQDNTELNNIMYAMAAGAKPIRTKDDLVRTGYQSRCDTIGGEWKRRIDTGMWWSTGYRRNDITPEMRKMFTLRDRLLAFGGSEACLPIRDQDYDALMEYGQVWIGHQHITLRKGVPSRCHENSCYQWLKYRNQNTGTFGIATGYALSQDGMWRQHSWCILKKPRSYRIIETTERRELYYGFCMTGEIAQKWVENILEYANI